MNDPIRVAAEYASVSPADRSAEFDRAITAALGQFWMIAEYAEYAEYAEARLAQPYAASVPRISSTAATSGWSTSTA